MDYKGNKKLVPLAKSLRKNMTKEERHLWYDFLREHPARFSRQKVFGKYILDFYSAREQLAIEIDGEHHYCGSKMMSDSERTGYINEYGVNVLRFSNREINENFSAVCQFIDDYIARKKQLGNRIENHTPIERL